MLRNVFKQALTESHVRDNITDISTVALLIYGKTCPKRPLKKIDKTKVLKTNGSLY